MRGVFWEIPSEVCEKFRVSCEGIMGTNGGFVPSTLLALDGNNWKRWSALMKSLFGAQDVLESVENWYEDLGANPTDAHRVTFKELKRKDCKALQLEEYVTQTSGFEDNSIILDSFFIFCRYV